MITGKMISFSNAYDIGTMLNVKINQTLDRNLISELWKQLSIDLDQQLRSDLYIDMSPDIEIEIKI